MDVDILEKYKRSANIPYPNVYSKFKGRKEVNNKTLNFIVQDLTEDMIDVVAEMMIKYFIYEEPAHKHSKFYEDLVSVAEEREIIKMVLSQQLGLVCLVENDDGQKGTPVIAGFNVTYIKCKEEGEEMLPQGEKINDLRIALKWLDDNIKNPYDHFKISEYLNAAGLYVLKEYRRQGISDELLSARIALCKNIGMKYTVTPFTSPASQKVAARCGFKTLVKETYDDLNKRAPSVFKYPDISKDSMYYKLMYLRID